MKKRLVEIIKSKMLSLFVVIFGLFLVIIGLLLILVGYEPFDYGDDS